MLYRKLLRNVPIKQKSISEFYTAFVEKKHTISILMRKKVNFWLENANIFVDMKKELWYKNKWLENANAMVYK